MVHNMNALVKHKLTVSRDSFHKEFQCPIFDADALQEIYKIEGFSTLV